MPFPQKVFHVLSYKLRLLLEHNIFVDFLPGEMDFETDHEASMWGCSALRTLLSRGTHFKVVPAQACLSLTAADSKAANMHTAWHLLSPAAWRRLQCGLRPCRLATHGVLNTYFVPLVGFIVKTESLSFCLSDTGTVKAERDSRLRT